MYATFISTWGILAVGVAFVGAFLWMKPKNHKKLK